MTPNNLKSNCDTPDSPGTVGHRTIKAFGKLDFKGDFRVSSLRLGPHKCIPWSFSAGRANSTALSSLKVISEIGIEAKSQGGASRLVVCCLLWI